MPAIFATSERKSGRLQAVSLQRRRHLQISHHSTQLALLPCNLTSRQEPHTRHDPKARNQQQMPQAPSPLLVPPQHAIFSSVLNSSPPCMRSQLYAPSHCASIKSSPAAAKPVILAPCCGTGTCRCSHETVGYQYGRQQKGPQHTLDINSCSSAQLPRHMRTGAVGSHHPPRTTASINQQRRHR